MEKIRAADELVDYFSEALGAVLGVVMRHCVGHFKSQLTYHSRSQIEDE